MIKRLAAYSVVLAVAGVIILSAVLIVSTVSPLPRVEKGQGLTFDRIKRVKQLVHRHVPRYMRFRQTRTVRIQEQDLNLLLDYGISQGLKTDDIHGEISLWNTMITLEVSVKIPKTFLGEYANLTLGVTHDDNRLDIAFIQAGRLTIPGMAISPLISIAGKHILPPEVFHGLKESLDGIKSISTRKKSLTLVYDWNPSSLLKLHENGKALLIPLPHQEKLVLYANQLTRILDILKSHEVNTLSLARVLRPLFRFAADQSATSHDPILENTALLESLALYALGENLDHLVNADLLKQVRPRRHAPFTLHGRTDLAKHFLVSAGLAVSAGTRLSHFAGLAKEVEDAGRGSGFSFADLAADRAGVKLGQLAGGSLELAKQIQSQMATVTTEAGFMPGIADLPEGIMELEFKKRYTDLDSQAYGMIDSEINRRLNACGVYRAVF